MATKTINAEMLSEMFLAGAANIEAKKEYIAENVTFISQNCIGGVIYHDMGQKFLSPTINCLCPLPIGDNKSIKRIKYFKIRRFKRI